MRMKTELSGFVEGKAELFFAIIFANLADDTGGMLLHRQARWLHCIRVCSRNSRAEPENFGGTAEIGGRDARDARATQIPMGEGRAFAAPKRLRPRRRGEGNGVSKSEVIFARVPSAHWAMPPAYMIGDS